LGKAFGCFRNSNEVFGDRAFVADSVVDVGEAESVDLGDVEITFEILEAAIEGRYMQRVSLGDKVGQDFLGAGGVAGAFSVDSVEDVGQGGGEYSVWERPCGPRPG
jgi:hypothetical protein